MSQRSAAMAQFNVRMDPRIKSAGDATLEHMDITPTQLVRAVWEKIGYGEEAAEQLLYALAQHPRVGKTNELDSQRDDVLEKYQRRREEFCSHIEQIAGPPPSPLSDEEMEELLYEENLKRYQEELKNHAS